MKKFRKNNKKNTILIIAVVFVIGLVVSTTLIKSHAYFEATKSFNVIQGKIPTKAKGDVGIAVLIDGEKSNTIPEKDSGYHFVGSECNNEANATWNEISWNVSVNNLKKSGTVCELKFETGDLTFNYGDGSLNLTTYVSIPEKEEYEGHLALYDLETSQDVTDNYQSKCDGWAYNNFNYDKCFSINASNGATKYTSYNYIDEKGNYFFRLNQGENEVLLNDAIKGDNNSVIHISSSFIQISLTNAYGGFSSIKLNLDNQYYTLEEAVNAKKIKPIVQIRAGSTTSYVNNKSVQKIYQGGELVSHYLTINFTFMLEKNVVFNKIKENSRNDGDMTLSVYKLNNKILYLK